MAGTRKGTYKITNWRKYNESLVQRGSVTFWFSEDVIRQWRHANGEARRGHPFFYSDTADDGQQLSRLQVLDREPPSSRRARTPP